MTKIAIKSDEHKMIKDNPMRKITVEKLTLNIGAGKDQAKLEKAEKLLAQLTGIAPVRTKTDKRLAAWGLRPGLPIGCKLTLRGKNALEMIPRLLSALDFRLDERNFDENGNVSFGIKEYIDVRDAKYDPTIGIIGLQASVTLKRPGFRIKSRKLLKKPVPLRHRIPRQEGMDFMKQSFNVKFIT